MNRLARQACLVTGVVFLGLGIWVALAAVSHPIIWVLSGATFAEGLFLFLTAWFRKLGWDRLPM